MSEKTNPPVTTQASASSLGARLRAKAPELAFEMISIGLAVMAALAVDQWRQSRADADLAETARAGVIDELVSNRGELEHALNENTALLAALNEELSNDDDSISINIQFEFALVSTAAWETAQSTGATRHLDFDWVVDISRLYRLEVLFEESQARVVEAIGDFMAPDNADVAPRLRELRQQLQLTISLTRNVIDATNELLDRDPELISTG
ncbi:MAG: hypothetical protein GKS06_00255 [Acidobacteria bacterium]|nr:hypothetical protein [Acidobacteriota bacterium]